MKRTVQTLAFFVAAFTWSACFMVPSARAEFRSARDMQKECRVALRVLDGTEEKTFENVLFAGECIGYVQGVVDANPKYTLASTAVQMMLAQEYGCKK
jgi:uncharacterized membrane protein